MPEPQRREARSFEPPPWEKDRFDELRREREERDAAERVAAESATQAAALQEPDAAAGPDTAGDRDTAAPDETGASDASGSRSAEAMLAQLAAEEPRLDRQLGNAGLFFAGVLGAIGAVLVVWGAAAISTAGRTGGVGLTGGAALVTLGGMFAGTAAWVIVSNLRKRGVI